MSTGTYKKYMIENRPNEQNDITLLLYNALIVLINAL